MKLHCVFRRITALILSLCLLLSLAACGSGGGEVHVQAGNLLEGIKAAEAKGKAADSRFTSSQYAFAADLMKGTYKKDCNCLVSPLSVALALAMTANGAAGDTLTQMLNVIGGGCGLSDLNAYLYQYVKDLPTSDKVKMHIADSIWLNDRDDFTVRNEFLSDCAGWYDAAVYKLPFDDSAVKEINGWVSKNTDDMIKKIVESIGPNDRMMLLNAICFDAKWLLSFNGSPEAAFTRADGEKEKAAMMYSLEGEYYEGDGYVGFSKPYASGYKFVGILPDENVSLDAFIAGLDGEKLSSMLGSAVRTDVRIGLPKFTYRFGTSLAGCLKDLGMNDAFGPAADFSPMSSDTDLYVSGVEHMTFIEVTEAGTRAAAVTGVTMAAKSASPAQPKSVILDRPFLYMIVDTANNLPVLIGAVNSVK